MPSRTDIANLTLTHLGQGVMLDDLDKDDSTYAKAIRSVWKPALEAALRAFDWSFARRRVRLDLESSRETTTPGEEWVHDFEFAYQYPFDCVNFRKIPSRIRRESEDQAIPFQLAYGDSGQVIVTDQEDALGEYTILVEDTNRYPPDFVMAYSFLLAAYAAPRIAGTDAKVREQALQFFQYEIERARASAANEGRRDLPPDPEMIRVRG